MSVEIIVIGSDLISGDVAEKNSRFLAVRLLSLGMAVSSITIVGDEEHIVQCAVERAIESKKVRIILITGGLGPANGDITSKVAARITGRRLVLSDEVLRHIRSFMEMKGKKMLPSQERQALIPQKAEILRNPIGTVCGFLIRHEGKVIAFLPGEPGEMARIADEVLLPALMEEFKPGVPVRSRIFRTFGLQETEIEDMISSRLEKIRGLKVNCIPSPAEVAVKVSIGDDGSESKLEEATCIIREVLGDSIFGEDVVTMEETVGNLLRLKGKTISVAESCTGGLISHRLTNIPGSSDYFTMGFMTYSDDAKIKLLGVQPSLIKEYGAVSMEVAMAMAAGAQRMGRTSYSLAATGIAGPAGGSPEKPVGTVFIALSSEKGTECRKFSFTGDRGEIKNLTAQNALDMLRRNLIST